MFTKFVNYLETVPIRTSQTQKVFPKKKKKKLLASCLERQIPPVWSASGDPKRPKRKFQNSLTFCFVSGTLRNVRPF